MSDIRSRGRKKSLFPGITSIPSDATLDFVSGGVNYKITLADFLAALSVTGTIVPLGDGTSTPVLDVQGTVNRIRNLANGAGVKSQVNVNGGITLLHNFEQDNAGLPILKNITNESPDFISLIAGNGIGLSADANKITVSVSGSAAATKVVSINVLGDFPDPVSGAITLESNTVYLLVNGVTTSNRFIMQDGTAIVSYDPLIAPLEYTGVGTMFTGVDADVTFRNAQFICTNGTFIDMSETGAGHTKTVNMVGCTLSPCTAFGTVDDLLEMIIENNRIWDLTQGLVVSGAAWNNIRVTQNSFISLSATFVALNITGAVTARISLGDNYAFGPPGAIGVKGDAASANIVVGGLGTLYRNSPDGGLIAESGMGITDAIRWRAAGNEEVSDTRADALLSMQNNATTTAISGSSTDGSNAVLVAGTWTVGAASHMEGTTGGRVTSKGERDARLPTTASVSIEPASGTNVTMSVYFALNGVVDVNSKRSAAASAGSPASVTVPWQLDYAEDDYAEIFVENNDNSTNILVSSGVLRAN